MSIYGTCEVCGGETKDYDCANCLRFEVNKLREAIETHHAQKADDRCIEDDDRLYAAAGLPPCDRRVGDKAEMLKNCKRFIDQRCEGGGWPSYAELEAELKRTDDQRKMLIGQTERLATELAEARAEARVLRARESTR